jgi:arylsulfatase
MSLLGTEAIAIAVLVLLAAPLFRLKLHPKLGRGLRAALTAALLIGLAASWITFWLSGQFLDGRGIRFAAANASSVLGYASQVNPFLLYALPLMLIAGAVAACELAPRLLPACADPAVGRASLGVLGLALAVSIGGEIGHRFAKEKITDPATGSVYSRDDLYRLRRERNTGPLTHLVAGVFGSKDPFDDGTAEAPQLVRRPLEPMERYLSRVDRDRLKRWNVVVVLIDSLRVDQLRATGGAREVMPALERLAQEGRVYPDCVTPASHTDYACPAVFSSHHPLRARDVYRYPKDPPYPRVLIYDVLKSLGWRTGLFSSQDEEWGQMMNFMQTGGLDVFFHSRTAGASGEATKDHPAFAAMIDDSITVGEALKWIEAAPDAPFFLYLNLQNSHLPYAVPSGFPRRFSPKERDFEIKIGWFPEEKAAAVKDVYADSLAYVDSQLDRLLGRLKERGLWDRTLIVVSGDHGEAFYEHGTAAHANGVHEEVIKVPLVVRAPGLPAGRDTRPAHLLDVAPGVFHLLGLPVHPSFQGENLFASESRADRTRYMISDTPWKTQIGVMRSGFKLIRDGDTGGSVLYDLAKDPGEKVDATQAHPERARELKARLSAWRRAQLEYYENPLRQACEYPPVILER